MKTFTETLRINQCKRQLTEAFYLMSRSGIDPMRFVDWYTLDGIEKQNQGLLVEASEEWLRESWWDSIKKGVGNAATWVKDGVTDIATGNIDYGAIGDRAKKVGGVVGNVATALPAAGMAMAGGAARGLIGAGAKNLAGGAMGGLGLGGNNKTDPNAPAGEPGAAPPGSPPGAAPPGKGEQPPEAQPANPIDAHMKNAHSALDALSKRMGNSKNLAQQLGGQQFQSMVANLLYMIKNNQALQPAEAAPATAAKVPPAPVEPGGEPGAGTSHSSETPRLESFSRFTGRIRLRTEIKTGLRELQEYGVDPVKFVDWYIEEGQYLNENAVGDWFGRQWAGLGGLFSGKGYMKAGEEWQSGKDQKRDDDAVQNAINTLWQFEREMKNNKANFTDEFAQLLGQVRDGLHKRAGMAGKSAEGGEPAKPAAGEGPAAPADGTPADAKPADPAAAEAMLNPDDPSFNEEMFKQQMATLPQPLQDEVANLNNEVIGKLSGQPIAGMTPEQIDALAKGLNPDQQKELQKATKQNWYQAYQKHKSASAPPAPKPPDPPAPAAPSSSADTPRMEGVFYRYLKQRA